MKKLLLSVLFLTGTFLLAQEKLVVEYEEYNIFEFKESEKTVSSSPRSQEIDKAIEESMKRPTYFELTLTQKESFYKKIEKLDNSQKDGISVSVVGFSTDNAGDIYKNLDEKLTVRHVNFFNKNILIEEPIIELDWKITRESKEVLGYEVRKATAQVDSINLITAWYAPKLAFSNGPKNYQGLPGLILEAEISSKSNLGKTHIIASSIKVEKNDKPVKRPTKGEKMTAEEFNDYAIKQSENMQMMFEGGMDKD